MNACKYTFTLLLASATFASALQAAQPAMTREQANAYLDAHQLSPLRGNLTSPLIGGRVEEVEALLAAGVDPNEKDELPQTTLELAAMSCSGGRVKPADTVAMMDALLAAGARPNDPGMGGMTALISAAQKCPGVVLKRLIAGGAKLDARTPQGYTALSMALLLSNYDAAAVLIDAGARLSPTAARKLLDGHKADKRRVALVKRAMKN
ncbi:MAG: ankyrin repeat domain-containing protein [Rudaea sp.]